MHFLLASAGAVVAAHCEDTWAQTNALTYGECVYSASHWFGPTDALGALTSCPDKRKIESVLVCVKRAFDLKQKTDKARPDS